MTDDARPDEPVVVHQKPEEPMLFCPVCSSRPVDQSCKLVCPTCGYYMSCADYY